MPFFFTKYLRVLMRYLEQWQSPCDPEGIIADLLKMAVWKVGKNPGLWWCPKAAELPHLRTVFPLCCMLCWVTQAWFWLFVVGSSLLLAAESILTDTCRSGKDLLRQWLSSWYKNVMKQLSYVKAGEGAPREHSRHGGQQIQRTRDGSKHGISRERGQAWGVVGSDGDTDEGEVRELGHSQPL